MRTPVLLRHTVVDHWPALSRWSPKYFMDHQVDTLINARNGTGRLFIGRSGRDGLLDTALLHDAREIGRNYRVQNISLKAFIEKVDTPHPILFLFGNDEMHNKNKNKNKIK